jgi:hypothetical protein
MMIVHHNVPITVEIHHDEFVTNDNKEVIGHKWIVHAMGREIKCSTGEDGYFGPSEIQGLIEQAEHDCFKLQAPKLFESIKSKLGSDITGITGKGNRDNFDWVLVETPRGRLSIKQEWATKGDPRGVTTWIMADFQFTKEEMYKYGEDVGYLHELGVPQVSEPIGFRYVEDY